MRQSDLTSRIPSEDHQSNNRSKIKYNKYRGRLLSKRENIDITIQQNLFRYYLLILNIQWRRKQPFYLQPSSKTTRANAIWKQSSATIATLSIYPSQRFIPLKRMISTSIFILVAFNAFMRCNSFSALNRFKLQHRKVKNNIHWFSWVNFSRKQCVIRSNCVRESSRSWVGNNHLLSPSCLLTKQIGSDTAKFLSTNSSFAETTTNHDNDSQRQLRKDRLHYHLIELGIDAESLANAAHRSISTTGMLHIDKRQNQRIVFTHRSTDYYLLTCLRYNFSNRIRWIWFQVWKKCN